MTRKLRDLLHRIRDFDRVLLVAVVVLCLIGVVMVYDAGSFRSEASRSTSYLAKHLQRLLIGVVALIGLSGYDYHKLRKPLVRYGLLAVGVGLVASTVLLAIIGIAWAREGATRWFFFIQPVEIAKLALILHLAHVLAPGWDRIRREKERLAWAFAVPAVAVVALALQPNFANVLVFSLLTVVALILTGLPQRWIWRMGGGAVVLVGLGILFVPRIQHRVGLWWGALRGEGVHYQVQQGLIGSGSGGLLGQGFGHGHQRLAFLPDAHTDFIFAVLGENAGLVGSLLVLFLFVLFAWRGYKIAERAGDGFGRLLAAGLTTMIIIYAAINLGMVTGLLPVMGLPLPFVSYGGSALITNLAAVGILFNIDRDHREIQSRLQRMRRP